MVDTRGRVWPSARVAAPLVRSHHVTLQRAASRGTGAAGCLWRYLTPSEVALVPPTARAGDALPRLAWPGAVSAHGLAVRGPPHGLEPTHPPQDSPTPPSMGPKAGGPRHTP